MIIEYFFIAFIITIFLFIIGIPFLRRINCGQYVRVLGPKEHYKKNGTPTMGGVYIVFGIVITISFYFYVNKLPFQELIIYLLPLILFSIIGFIDDYLKVIKKNNNGMNGKTKILLEILFSCIYIFVFNKHLTTTVTFFDMTIDLKYFYYILVIFLFVASSNAYNLCDGMDGLAGGLSVLIFCGLLIISKEKGSEINNTIIFIIVLIGSLFAFLCYNFSKAKVFMGDVGSLSLGVTIANLFIILKCEIVIVFFGLVMIIEAMSVIIQVMYFKITKGKRLLLMAPLHHHFELKGYNEKRVVISFYLIQILCIIIGLIYFQYFN